MIPTIDYLSVAPETFMERYGYGYGLEIEYEQVPGRMPGITWRKDPDAAWPRGFGIPEPPAYRMTSLPDSSDVLAVHIGRHDYLVAEVAWCAHCAHTSPLRDLRGGCVACGAPMKWLGNGFRAGRITFDVESVLVYDA